MTQYLVAMWDYIAEGEFELSFKQGDRIKLLEKHNDDWWEGELNDEIGFFPANRIRLEESENLEHDTENEKQANFHNLEPPAVPTVSLSRSLGNPSDIQRRDSVPSAASAPLESVLSSLHKLTDSPLPNGWEYAHDEEGTIYYFNESTGETSWDKPTGNNDIPANEPHFAIDEDNEVQRDESTYFLQRLNPNELSKLEYDKLEPDWVRHKGAIQMKMYSEKEDGTKLSSWKVYHAVLSNGFLLLYKEGHAKGKKSSGHPVPVGCFDLDSCEIGPAGKQDTRRKHVFIITTPKKVKIFVQTSSDKDFSAWLDAIMRELVARKEDQHEDTEIMRLLKSLTIDESHMKVNRKMTQESTEDKKKLGHWFSSKTGSKSSYSTQKIDHMPAYGQTQPYHENDLFGGYLRTEENGDIPHIVMLCIKEVEARGLNSVGIYRLSGPASAIQKYRAAVNNREKVSFKHETDINTVTGLLKLYFRELRDPLMTYEYFDYFIEAARIDDYEERMYQIKSVVQSLPKPNYTVLEYLMRHLSLVAAHSGINKMEAPNLALIFSIGLLRSEQEDISSFMMSDSTNKIIEAIILQVDWFFEKDKEEADQLVEPKSESTEIDP